MARTRTVSRPSRSPPRGMCPRRSAPTMRPEGNTTALAKGIASPAESRTTIWSEIALCLQRQRDRQGDEGEAERKEGHPAPRMYALSVPCERWVSVEMFRCSLRIPTRRGVTWPRPPVRATPARPRSPTTRISAPGAARPPPPSPASRRAPPPPASMISPGSGAALGDRYQVERVLGEGGMATVYLAHDRKHNRKVAVKVMRPELASTLGADRFLREVEIAAQLSHPHILPMYDSGAGRRRPLLRHAVRRGRVAPGRIQRERQLPVEDVLRLAREVAEALAVRARARHRPSRHQARQRPAHRRARAGGRLRHRARHGRQRGDHRDRHRGRHAALHESGAGHRRSRSRRAHRRVRARRRAVRDARGRAAVHRAHGAGDPQPGASRSRRARSPRRAPRFPAA